MLGNPCIWLNTVRTGDPSKHWGSTSPQRVMEKYFWHKPALYSIFLVRQPLECLSSGGSLGPIAENNHTGARWVLSRLQPRLLPQCCKMSSCLALPLRSRPKASLPLHSALDCILSGSALLGLTCFSVPPALARSAHLEKSPGFAASTLLHHLPRKGLSCSWGRFKSSAWLKGLIQPA